MRPAILVLAIVSILAVPAASAQTVCAQAPVTTWTVQYFEKWEEAVAKMVANSAYKDTMSIVPVRSATKNGYVVSFEKIINFTNDCPPKPIETIEQDTLGWHRQLIDSPSLAEAFVAALPSGTPVSLMSLHAGYAAGAGSPGRRRGVTHSSVMFPQRGVVVLWFE
jgi:hypothetical protein